MNRTSRSVSLSLLGLCAVLSPLACSSPAETTSAGGSSSGTAGTAGAGTGGEGAATSGTGASGGAGQGGTGTGTGGKDACATAVFCDDFEAYEPGGAPGGAWSVSTNKGAVAMDTAQAFSGSRAVKVTGDAAPGYRSAMIVLENTGFLPVAGNVLYGRMMFRLESAPEGNVHWTFIDADGLVPGQQYHAVYRYGGQHPITDNGVFVGNQLMANYETPDSYQSPPVGPGSDCWHHADKKVVPVGVWACAEWMFDGPGNKMRFWLDGKELPDLAVDGTGQGCVKQDATFPWTAPTFERIHLGWESYQPDDARVLWIDDVGIGTERLGCPAPE